MTNGIQEAQSEKPRGLQLNQTTRVSPNPPSSDAKSLGALTKHYVAHGFIYLGADQDGNRYFNGELGDAWTLAKDNRFYRTGNKFSQSFLDRLKK